MKVVLFCGGLGLRLRDYSDAIPKPLVPVGPQPVLWNVMRYYAHYGHKDFILCLGHQGEAIKQFFLGYNEAMANDFTMSEGGAAIDLHQSDIHDWKITFVDTGLRSNIGERLKRVQEHLEGEDVFLANYSNATPAGFCQARLMENENGGAPGPTRAGSRAHARESRGGINSKSW